MLPFLKGIGIVVAGWVLVSGGAELVFRLLGDQPSLDLQHLYASFSRGNYRLAANVDTAANFAAGRLTIHTDPLGLRCDEQRRFGTRAGDQVDVMLLGDSQGFGNGVQFESSLAGSAAIAAASDGFRVANASVGGHSASSQLQLAEALHREYGIKVSNYVLLVTPAIAQGGEHLNRATVGADGRLYDGPVGYQAAFRVWMKTNLVAYSRVRDAVRNSNLIPEPQKDVPFVINFYRTGAAEAELRQSFAGFAARLKNFAATQGARVHLVYVPLTLEMEFDPIRSSAAARGIQVDRDVPRRICSDVARSLGVPFHDLRPILEALHAQGNPLHLRGDFHYNQELSRACGVRIWEALRPAMAKPTHIVSQQR